MPDSLMYSFKKLSDNNLGSFLIEDDPLPYDIDSLSTNDGTTNSEDDEESDNQTRDRKVPDVIRLLVPSTRAYFH
jgi:hypothetical protein